MLAHSGKYHKLGKEFFKIGMKVNVIARAFINRKNKVKF